jgi:hypothetical protein
VSRHILDVLGGQRSGTGTHRALLLRLRAAPCIAMGPCPQFRLHVPRARPFRATPNRGQRPIRMRSAGHQARRKGRMGGSPRGRASARAFGAEVRQTRIARAPEPVGLSQNLRISHMRRISRISRISRLRRRFSEQYGRWRPGDYGQRIRHNPVPATRGLAPIAPFCVRVRASLCIAMGPCPHFRSLSPGVASGTATHPDAVGSASVGAEQPDGWQSPPSSPAAEGSHTFLHKTS